MHIKNPQSALLSNHEVLLHLLSEEQGWTDAPKLHKTDPNYREKPSGLNHMLRDGIAYLITPEFSTVNLKDAHPDRPMTLYKGPRSLFRVLSAKYRLNKAEYLQIFNLRPKNLAELELVVEEAGSRFTEDELYDILAIIGKVFDEEEAGIPAGVEHQQMEKIPNKLLGAKKTKRRKRV